MKKRLFSLFCITLLITSLVTTAKAGSIQPYASDYLAKYTIAMGPGSNAGELLLAYSVVGTGNATTTGIKKLDVYKANGTYVTTIYGTTSNKLLRSSSSYNSGTYTYKGVSGTSYYMLVTVYAGDSYGSDTRTVTTNTVKAP